MTYAEFADYISAGTRLTAPAKQTFIAKFSDGCHACVIGAAAIGKYGIPDEVSAADNILSHFEQMFPILTTSLPLSALPKETHDYFGRTTPHVSFANALIELNDVFHWSRFAIAAWVRGLDNAVR